MAIIKLKNRIQGSGKNKKNVNFHKGKAKRVVLYTFALISLLLVFSFLLFPEKTINRVLGDLSKIEFKLLAKVSPWINQKVDPQGPQLNIASHRGLVEASRVENSSQSIEAALKAGFQGLEIDISFSSDFKPYVFHGPNLELVGLDGNFSKYSSFEIEKFRLPNGQPVIPLDAFCMLYALEFETIYLDIKGDDSHYNEKAQNLCRVLKNYEYKGIVLIGAPWRTIKAVKKKISRIKVGYEQKGALANFILGADTVSLYYKYEFSYIEYKLAKLLGLDVVIWTVNDIKLLKQYSEKFRMSVLTDLNVQTNSY